MSFSRFLVGIFFVVCACANGQSTDSIYWDAKVSYLFSNTVCSGEIGSEELVWVTGIGSTSNSIAHSRCIVRSGEFGSDFEMTIDPLKVSGKTTIGMVYAKVLGWESDGGSAEDVDGGLYPTSSCSNTPADDDCYESKTCFYSLPYGSTDSAWKTTNQKCCTSGGWCANFVITYTADFCRRNRDQCGVGGNVAHLTRVANHHPPHVKPLYFKNLVGTCVSGSTIDAYTCTCMSGFSVTYVNGMRTCTKDATSPTPLPTGDSPNPTPLPTGGGSNPSDQKALVSPGYIRVTDFPQENCAGTGVSESFKGDMSCQSFQGTNLKGECSESQATLFVCADAACENCEQVSIVAEGDCGSSLAGGVSSSYVCGTQVNAGSFISPCLFALVAAWVNAAA